MLRLLLALALLVSYAQASTGGGSEARVHTHLPHHGPILPNRWLANSKAPAFGLYIGLGTWDAGKEHLKMFLKEHSRSYRTFTATEIRDGELSSSGIHTLIMPGGESWEYLKELGEEGGGLIKSFVEKGGGYIGICAGAFYATSMREGGAATGPYGIGLLDGTAYDGTALHTEPFIEGMMDIPSLPHFLMNGLSSQFRIVMFGGPSFHFTPEEAAKKDVQVLSEFQKVHEPAMITLRYGRGKVFLSGPHLEIEEDRTDWGAEFQDPDSEWPLLERLVNYL